MSPSDYGLIGGIIGVTLGLLGGIAGTYFSIRNTKSDKERGFVIRVSIIVWIVVIVVAIAAYFIPSPYKVFASMPVWIGLPIVIVYWNKRQAEIRGSEGQDQGVEDTVKRD